MSASFTLKFDGWAPDLQNVAIEADGSSGSVPCADCLNVYYQDAAFRCLPGPNPLGPTLGTQALNLFSGYDNIAANNYVYAATANGISIFQNGVWGAVPVEPSVTVALTGIGMQFNTGGTGGIGAQRAITGMRMNTGTGKVGTSGGFLYSGTMVAGFTQSGLGGTTTTTGYQSGQFGSLSPTTTYAGITVTSLATTVRSNGSSTEVALVGVLPQNYFTRLTIPTISVSLASASASSFLQSGNTAIWTWSGAISLLSGNSYAVRLIL